MKQDLLKKIKRYKASYVLIAPYMVLFVLFTVIPVILSMILSLTYFNGIESAEFVGWGNYLNLFVNDDIFLIAVKNTLLFAAITGPVSYIACFVIAWIINDLSPGIRAVLTLMFYAPTLTGGAAYVIWQVFFSGDSYGYFNSLLLKLGALKEPVIWLKDTRYMLAIIIVVQLWMSLGTSFLAFIGGLQTIDRSLYEAGATDGIRNRWQELWFITLPAMRPFLLFGAVIQVTSTFAVSEVSEVLAGFPSVDYAAHTVMTHLLDYGGLRFELGYSSAIATVLFVVMLGTNKTIQKLLRKVGE